MQQEAARKRIGHSTISPGSSSTAKVDPEIVKVVKAAAMVEHNGGDYATYLCNVFHDDPEFQQAARHGPRKKCSTARRSPPGPGSPIRASISTPASSASPTASRSVHDQGLDPRLALGRAGRALHRRDRHQLLLHGADGGGGRAGAEGNLPQHRRRRAPALQALLRSPAPLSEVGEDRALGALAVALARMRESEDDELAYAYFAANGAEAAPL